MGPTSGLFLKLTVSQKVKYRVSGQIILVGILLGVIYVMFSNGFSELIPFINGAISGALIGILISFLELWIFTGGIRKLKFIYLLLLRTTLYLFLIVFILTNVVATSRMLRLGMSYSEVLNDGEFQHYLLYGNFSVGVLYALFFAFSINFTRMMSRKMGQGVLVSFITGTFYRPVLQERIVMFIGLGNVGEFTSRLSEITFFKFINEYFYDITEPIVKHQGIIYEYVEDTLVVTWRMEKGLFNANCVRTFHAIKDRIEQKREKYFTKYGLIPTPIGSIHTGRLVRAEIGNIKTQIVFHGDVMNTTSRLLSKGRELGEELLVSEDLIGKVDLPLLFESKAVGSMSLRGKQNPIEVFSIHDKELLAI